MFTSKRADCGCVPIALNMAIHKLDNYMRMYRKRTGLSQPELAYLLGVKSAAAVSRYERFKRVPTLESAFASQMIYDVPIRDLFAGVAAKAERAVQHRARVLEKRLSTEGRYSPRVLQLLGEVAPSKERKDAA